MLVVNYVKEIFIICSISNRRQNFRFLFAMKTVGDIVPSAIFKQKHNDCERLENERWENNE